MISPFGSFLAYILKEAIPLLNKLPGTQQSLSLLDNSISSRNSRKASFHPKEERRPKVGWVSVLGPSPRNMKGQYVSLRSSNTHTSSHCIQSSITQGENSGCVLQVTETLHRHASGRLLAWDYKVHKAISLGERHLPFAPGQTTTHLLYFFRQNDPERKGQL